MEKDEGKVGGIRRSWHSNYSPEGAKKVGLPFLIFKELANKAFSNGVTDEIKTFSFDW
jgi:hypothetical protein